MSLFASAKTIAKDFLESRSWPKRPERLSLEITAACDARCIHCPRQDMDRAMKPMPLDLWRRILDQAEALGVPEINPNGYGEICTIPVPALTEYFEVIAAKGHPFRITMNSNGNRLTKERAELFIKHKVKLINVTIDGATKETAESIRVKLDFDQVEGNVRQLIAMRNAAGKKYPKVRVGMIAMPQTIPEVDLFFSRWRGVVDFIGLGGFSSRLTSVEKEKKAAKQDLLTLGGVAAPSSEPVKQLEPQTCVLPFRELNVWADGKAVLCCEDWNEEFVVGDLTRQTLDEVWHGPVLAEARRKHYEKAGRDIWLCEKCNAWKPPGSGARLWK